MVVAVRSGVAVQQPPYCSLLSHRTSRSHVGTRLWHAGRQCGGRRLVCGSHHPRYVQAHKHSDIPNIELFLINS